MIPSQIERETLIDAPLEVVWGVVTEPAQINRWFTDAAQLDLRPGGRGELARQALGLLVLDVQAHRAEFYHLDLSFFHPRRWDAYCPGR